MSSYTAFPEAPHYSSVNMVTPSLFHLHTLMNSHTLLFFIFIDFYLFPLPVYHDGICGLGVRVKSLMRELTLGWL